VEWIDATEAAARLGVKPATLYSYVSRGVLRRRSGSDGRRSLFDAAEVAELARRGRPRRTAGTELVIESELTALGDDRPYYRGRDAVGLAATCGFEQVAGWLWTGDPTQLSPAAHEPWRVGAAAREAALAAQHGLPSDVLPLDRMQVVTTVLAAADPLRFHLDIPAVVAAGQGLAAGLVECLPEPNADAHRRPDEGTIAARLWSRLTIEPPDRLLAVLEAALVLLADHELAASTLAARVAASVRADPYAVVLAGLGVVSGPLHGGASYGAERMLSEVHSPAEAARVVGERIRRGDRIPGLGHLVYRAGDRRGTYLLELLRAALPGDSRMAAADAVLAEIQRRRLPEPNVDFALATLAHVAGMLPGAGQAIFAVARTAGWLAHAMEEYGRDTMLRPRAVYTGTPVRPRDDG
jgi:citrate synthase